jgi:hypothetical protein
MSFAPARVFSRVVQDGQDGEHGTSERLEECTSSQAPTGTPVDT